MSFSGIDLRPQANEWWYVRHRGASCLTTESVISFTDKTVVLVNADSFLQTPLRYSREDVEFVERVSQ